MKTNKGDKKWTERKLLQKKLLGIPLTQKEQAFYEMFLQGNEKEILKGIA